MADIFISYSLQDHEQIGPIAERLTALGYSLWRDEHRRSGKQFIEETERQLEEARVVLAVWSAHARRSSWVYGQACRGLDQGKLLQLKLDAHAPPAPFDLLPIADMSGERGEWGPLEDALQRLARGAGPATPDVRAPGLFATAPMAGGQRRLTAAAGAALAAYASAVTAATSGVIGPDQLQIALIGIIAVAGAGAALSAQRLLAVSRAGG